MYCADHYETPGPIPRKKMACGTAGHAGLARSSTTTGHDETRADRSTSHSTPPAGVGEHSYPHHTDRVSHDPRQSGFLTILCAGAERPESSCGRRDCHDPLTQSRL